MKKNLLLSLALCATGVAANAATHNIYVVNDAKWEELALYSWGDSEIFGGWPGAAPTATETINGVTYSKFSVDGNDGEAANLILNNNNNGAQIDLASITLDAENYYYATNGAYVVTVDPENPDIQYPDPATIYAIDKTGWDTLYAYGWADNQPEVLGGWPGTAMTSTVEIDGQTYKTAPFAGAGVDYNLIFNNNDASQVEGLTVPAGKDLYVEVTATEITVLPTPGVKYHKIYIDDRTGWENLYVYAYYDGAPSIFGGWPGALAKETETVDGITYKVLTAEETEDPQIFIFHNNDGTQYDVEGEYPITGNLFFTANTSGATTGVETLTDAPAAAEYYTLQCVRVSNPSNGIYIVRQGANTSKVVF